MMFTWLAYQTCLRPLQPPHFWFVTGGCRHKRLYRPAHARTQERGNHSDLCEHGRREQARERQPHHVETEDHTVESCRTWINLFVGAILSGNETDVIFRSQTQENENQQGWLSFFAIPLPGNQTTAKKKEKAEYENHTHSKYDSQRNINLRPIDEKSIRCQQNSP